MAKGSNPPGREKHVKPVCRNATAGREYYIEERLEAGIVLTGSEVKSLRDGGASLKESYVSVDGGEAFLVNANIAPYRCSSIFNHEPKRKRKLLLHRRQIERLAGRLTQEGMTAVPLQIYFFDGRAKVEIGVGKGKKLHDKREQIRKDEERREMRRASRDRGGKG